MKTRLLFTAFVLTLTMRYAPAFDVMEEMAASCERAWSSHGRTMITRCIERNRQNAHALLMYPLEMESVISGCARRSYVANYPLNWGVVRLCVKRDVNALVDVENLPAYQQPKVEQCTRSHGAYGWHMVMQCIIGRA